VVVGSPVRIEALAPIDAQSGVYLYNARTTEETMCNSWSRAQSIVTAYDRLTGSARLLQLRFNLALVAVSLLLVGLAIWFALRFADRQVLPLTNLVGAARKVGQGNFALRLEGRTGADEIGLLNRAFNRMTAQLEKQTQALVSANRQIDDRRAFTEAVLESVTAGVISVDANACVTLMNSSAQTLLVPDSGASMIGQSLEMLSPELCRMITEGKERAVITHAKDGELLTLAVKVAPGTSGHVITFEDITRQLLDQRQAAWSDVARRIAHEIKNPLTPIQLAAERLQRKFGKQIREDAETFGVLTGTIVRQVGDLRRMVDEFSDFARLPKPVFAPESPDRIVRQALVLQEVAFPAIRFSITGGTATPLVCDRQQMARALTNLVKNAAEAITARIDRETGEGRLVREGLIDIAIADRPDAVTITVTDNGIGLPTESRERLTEPYMTTRARGTGLGLAIVKKIIEDHGGTLELGDAEGGGAFAKATLSRAMAAETDSDTRPIAVRMST